jgi:hypothetical protein
MDQKIFDSLERGDIIKPRYDHRTFVVTGNYGGRITAVSTVDMTDPIEWDLVIKSHNKEMNRT